MKKRKFRAHFNRINMQRGNSKVWTVHTSEGCFQADRLIIEVPIESVFKPEGKQPRAYFSGFGCVSVHFDSAGTTVRVS